MIALIAAIGVGVVMALVLVRLFAGPTLYDRALAANSIVLKAALICAAVAVALNRSEGVEIAFVLVLGGFVLNTAVLKFFRARTFQAPLARAEERL
jgi:multicomponent Na+:H+ antiporter subunit F